MFKIIIVCAIATFVQKTTCQCIGRAVNSNIYRNPINSYAAENGYGVCGSNLAYPASALAYDTIANGIYGPANTLAYDGIPNIYGPTNTCDNGVYGLSLATLAASNCGGFSVRSSSPIGVNGILIETENMVIEGPLSVNGQLPFLGTVALEGTLPAAGTGAVSYGCGDGNIAILNEEYPSIAPPAPKGYGCNAVPSYGYSPAAAGQYGYTTQSPHGVRGFY
ncbi:chorion class CB protein M5H4-like [Nymphalis io]|uniref:chorion class CB protein M5H4-like n=1 Tax=Inachis io TaxID=171585 RepID=UPI002167CA6F|nr:chorion class CB protein M5H4-like [Nymphalis io]